MIESLENLLNMVQEGEIGFAEAGDWLHDNGDDILSELQELEELRNVPPSPPLQKTFGVINVETGRIMSGKMFDSKGNAKLSARHNYGNKHGVTEVSLLRTPGTLEVIDKQTNKWTKGD